MIFYTIRVKGTERYIGKQDSSYALVSDQSLGSGIPLQAHSAHWFVDGPSATGSLFRGKVWTNKTDVRSLVGRARRSPTDTFSMFEVVGSDDSVTPLDTFIMKEAACCTMS